MIGQLINNRTNEEYGLLQSPTPIGRHQGNAVRLRGFAISRFHAEIGQADGAPYLEDMGSTYGTFVNGKKVDGRVALRDDDQIVMGVSSGFPDGEYAFTFKRASGAGPAAEQARPSRPKQIKEGTTSVAETNGFYIATLEGVFRRHECDGFAQEIVKLVRAKPLNVVIELSRVDYMNSYALGTLVKLSQDVSDLGRSVALAGAQGLILKLFQTVGLDLKLGNFPTIEEAQQALAEGRVGME